MSTYFEKLYEVLLKEETLYGKMIELSEKKTEVIISNNIEELDLIVGREQLMLIDMDECEKERDLVLINIAKDLGLDPKTINLKHITANLSSQDKNKFLTLSQSLKTLLIKQKDLNDRNNILLKKNISYIHEVINQVVMGEVKNNIYNVSGDRSIVQKHNIIDKSV